MGKYYLIIIAQGRDIRIAHRSISVLNYNNKRKQGFK
jgi:hypothetical protein